MLLLQQESYPTILPRAKSGAFVGQGMNFSFLLFPFSIHSAPFPPKIHGSYNEKATTSYGPILLCSRYHFSSNLCVLPFFLRFPPSLPLCACLSASKPYTGRQTAGLPRRRGAVHEEPDRVEYATILVFSASSEFIVKVGGDISHRHHSHALIFLCYRGKPQTP